ncbi:MAG: response regulator [Bacteroidales bacterium]|nr:response regulator [Bacteroidales bacterium]
MKKTIVVGIPDKYLQDLISTLENNPNCKNVLKKYTSFQFFNDYKIGEADIIFLDCSIPDRDILQIAKKIRELDNKPLIIGVSLKNNPIQRNQFKDKINKSDYIVKTEDYSSVINVIFNDSGAKTTEKNSTFEKNGLLSDKTILVIDDFENTLNIVQYSLEQAGFNVVTALSGREALRKIDAKLIPNVIITDLNMPKMDGFELIENIRKFEHLKNIPIFILTTEFSVAKKIRAKDLNITGWIQKPYDITEFIEIIKKAI